MNAASTAVVRRHVARCVAWAWTIGEFGKVKVQTTVDVAHACHCLATFRKDTPKLAAAVRAKGVG